MTENPTGRYYLLDRLNDRAPLNLRGFRTAARWVIVDSRSNYIVDEAASRTTGQEGADRWNQTTRVATYTVFCKAPEDGRGEYSEEIDVDATTSAEALRKAQAVLDLDYQPGLRAVRTQRRVAGSWF